MLIRPMTALYPILVASLLLISFVTASTAHARVSTAQDTFDDDGACSFSKQLQNPQSRSEYIVLLAQATVGIVGNITQEENLIGAFAPVDSDESTLKVATAGFQVANSRYDKVSLKCLICHDGISAPNAEGTYRNTPGQREHGRQMAGKDHPVGMDYAAYSHGNSGFKGVHQLGNAVVLLDGKVGCLSCHNPLNPKKNHLVVSDQRSALCLTCHNK